MFELLDDQQLLAAAKAMLGFLFPAAAVPDAPAAYERSAWAADPLARGAFAFNAVGNTPDVWGELAVPVGGWLWFTGEHLAHGQRLQGTVRGAFETGREVALEMLDARDQLGLSFHLNTEFGSAASGNYQPIMRRYGCADDVLWVDPNGHSCNWYLDLGCPGIHMAGQRPQYYRGQAANSPELAEVYGDYGQFLHCPVACGSCVDRKCDSFPCAHQRECCRPKNMSLSVLSWHGLAPGATPSPVPTRASATTAAAATRSPAG